LGLLLLECAHLILEHFALEQALPFVFQALKLDTLWKDCKLEFHK
jgi:hypothetical protein